MGCSMSAVSLPLPNLKRILRAQGYTIREFARELGKPDQASWISNLCNCKSYATPETAAKIAELLDCKVSDLLKTPNVQTAMEDLVDEVRKYRQFANAVYEALGHRLPSV